MKLLLALLALALLASSAFGCLGETEEQLAKRFGKQTQTGTTKLPGVVIWGYKWNGFEIVVGLLNGKSAFERYSKLHGLKLNGNEVTALMNANNVSGGAWSVEKDPDFDGTKWVLDDGSKYAKLEKNGQALTVMTAEGADLLKSDTPKKK